MQSHWLAVAGDLVGRCVDDGAEAWDVWMRLHTAFGAAGACADALARVSERERAAAALAPAWRESLPAPRRALLDRWTDLHRDVAAALRAADRRGALAVGRRRWLASACVFHLNRAGLGEDAARATVARLVELWRPLRAAPMTDAAWQAFELAYEHPRERCERLLSCAGLLGDERWLWVDLGGPRPLVEIAARSPARLAQLREVPGVGPAGGAPRVLQPSLFPLGRVPGWFVPLLADSGLRALSLLAADPGRPVSWELVGAELRWLYARRLPDAGGQARALAWYERWLSRASPARVVRPSAEQVHAAVLARAAHVQVLRLRGPAASRAAEIELIRGLAARRA